MKIKKSMFNSLKGYKYIKQIKDNKSCLDIDCSKCPLYKCSLGITCDDIINISNYTQEDRIAIYNMNCLIEIFRKYYVNNKLKKYGFDIRYQQPVKYNDKIFNVLDIVKIKDNETKYFIVLLTGTDKNNIYLDKIKTVNKDDEYDLWVKFEEIYTGSDL